MTDGSQACAGDQEMSCWTGDFAWLTRQTMVDGTVMRFEQALPLFLSGKEMISGARMKFLPYLRECCGIGTCSRKKERVPHQAFFWSPPVQSTVCHTLILKF